MGIKILVEIDKEEKTAKITHQIEQHNTDPSVLPEAYEREWDTFRYASFEVLKTGEVVIEGYGKSTGVNEKIYVKYDILSIK